jgi:hypothetical protein
LFPNANISFCLGLGALLCALSTPLGAVDLPSGLSPELREVLVDEVGPEMWLRFRFVSAQLDPDADNALGFDAIEPDFALICAQLALPYAEKHGLNPDKIVISMADRFVEYGKTDPAATQFFEQFRLSDGTCIWEGF